MAVCGVRGVCGSSKGVENGLGTAAIGVRFRDDAGKPGGGNADRRCGWCG